MSHVNTKERSYIDKIFITGNKQSSDIKYNKQTYIYFLDLNLVLDHYLQMEKP